MKTQWHDNWSMYTINVTVSVSLIISEGPWRSSSKPTLFISFD